MVWSKDDKQQLAGTGGRVNGHARNRENRRQQYRENRSAPCGYDRSPITHLDHSWGTVISITFSYMLKNTIS